MSLEAEMMLERLKEQHLLQVEELHHQLEVKVSLKLQRPEDDDDFLLVTSGSSFLLSNQHLGNVWMFLHHEGF